MIAGTNIHSTAEPVTKVSELNLKLYTTLLWWSSLFTNEPSVTSHTLQEGSAYETLQHDYRRYVCSLPDSTTTPGRPGVLDHIKQCYSCQSSPSNYQPSHPQPSYPFSQQSHPHPPVQQPLLHRSCL